jgi:hypothetical protein
MKIKYLITFLLILASCSSLKDKPVTGVFTQKQWLEQTGWSAPTARKIIFEDVKLSRLQKLLKQHNFSFVIAASAVCDECKEQLPIMFRMFDNLGVRSNDITITGLDDNYTEPTGEYKKFNISTTPILFVLHEGKTIGSIIYPDTDWLGGILKIVE